MASVKGKGHEDEEKKITKSPTDAFVEHAKEESAEFRDFMVRYLPFTIIGYLLILLFFFSNFLSFNGISFLDCYGFWDLQDC